MSNTTNIIRQVISDYSNKLNTKIGSALYNLFVVPAGYVYDWMTAAIAIVTSNMAISTAADKEPLLENFGLDRLTATKSKGELYVKVSPKLTSYVFLTGTSFVAADGTIVVSTVDTTILTSSTSEGAIPVETTITGPITYPVQTLFTSIQYGNLLEKCYVKTQITGGTNDETDDELLKRIYTALNNTATTANGIEQALVRRFPQLIDALIESVGNVITVTIKAPLAEKQTDITTNKTVPGEAIRILSGTGKIETVTDPGTTKAITTFSGTGIITYSTFSMLSEIETAINNSEDFPLGLIFQVVHATPVFVTGTIVQYKPSTPVNVADYFNKHLLATFYMSDFLVQCAVQYYQLPVTLYFGDLPTTDSYSSVVALYYDDIKFI